MKITDQILHDILKKVNASELKMAKFRIIYHVFKNAINEQIIPQRIVLPSTRQLAKQLSSSRSTVIKAYELLLSNGYIEAKPGSGYRVKTTNKSVPSVPTEQNTYVELSYYGKSFLNSQQLLNQNEHKGSLFKPGVPPLDIFPINTWKRISNQYWQTLKTSDLANNTDLGTYDFKRQLCNYLALNKKIICHPDQTFVTGGSLQSVFLIGKMLINPGNDVAIENPTFPNIKATFNALGAKTTPLTHPLHKQANTLPDNCKLIHLSSSTNYPEGSQFSAKEKMRLLDKANKLGSYVIENDYELHQNNNTPSYYQLDTQDRTFYLGTFNRVLHPSIRISFMVVPQALTSSMHALIMHSHRFVSPAIQLILNSFIEQGHMGKHIQHLISQSSLRFATFINSFNQHLSPFLTLLHANDKNLFISAEFRDKVDDVQVCKVLAEYEIVLHPLSKCYLTGPKRYGLIIGYASVSNALIPKTVQRIAATLKYIGI